MIFHDLCIKKKENWAATSMESSNRHEECKNDGYTTHLRASMLSDSGASTKEDQGSNFLVRHPKLSIW